VGESVPAIVGRERELASVAAFLQAGGGERALLLTGEPGIGKTVLFEAGLAAAPGRVLARRQRPEQRSPGLRELFAGVAPNELPAPQRRALQEPGEADPQALRLGVLGALRALAADGPVVVAVDDLASLDAPCEAALARAALRLQEAPVRFLLTRSAGDPSELEQALLRPGLERLAVGPLPLAALRRVLPEADPAAGGNPRLARALAAGDEATVSATLDAIVGRPLASLAPKAAGLLLRVALAGEVGATGLDGLDDAVEARVVVVDHGRVRPAHPLLARRAWQRAGEDELRELAGVPGIAGQTAAHAARTAAAGQPAEAAQLARIALLLGDPPGARLLARETSPEEALERAPGDPWALALAALDAASEVRAVAQAETRATRALERSAGNQELEQLALTALRLAQVLRGDAIVEPADVLAEALRGDAEEAERLAPAALERGGWEALQARHALGLAALLRQEPARAVPHLRGVWDRCLREGVQNPEAFPVGPDLVEALLGAGAATDAAAVAGRLAVLANDHPHPRSTLAARRSAALLTLATSPAEAAAVEALEQAAAAYGRLDLRHDEARTWLSLGTALREARRWGAARSALQRAAEAFDELEARGWAELARGQLARVGARRPYAQGELTPAERRVVELAAAGLSNKEIAAQLVVTVNTVEVHLSRAYTKLGVRSRAHLAAKLA
jgi:DNA-binding NarL/FixJ family response regulator